MATHSNALPGIVNSDLYDHPAVIEGQIRALDDRIAQFGNLESQEESLVRAKVSAEAEQREVLARVQPEIDILSQLQPPLTEAKQRQLDDLRNQVNQAQARINDIDTQLASVRTNKEMLNHLYETRESRRQRLEASLAQVRASEPQPRPEPAAQAVATPAAQPATTEAPRVEGQTREQREISDDDRVELHALNYTDAEINEMSTARRSEIIRDQIRSPFRPRTETHRVEERRDERTVTDTEHRGIPWGGIALVLATLAFFLLLVWPGWLREVLITQQAPSQPAATAAPATLPVAPAVVTPSVSNFQTNPIDRNQRRFIVESTVPVTARLIDIDRDTVYAESKELKTSHNLVWTVPQFTELERTFQLKIELKSESGQVAFFGPLEFTVLLDSRAAGGVRDSQEFLAYLKEPTSGADRDALVRLIQSVAPSTPGVAELTSSNLVQFVESNMARFKVETLTSPLTGEFAYVRPDGSSGYSPVTLAAGTPVLTFEGKVLASALCVNEVKKPVPPPKVKVTPTPAPFKVAIAVIKFEDLDGDGVHDHGEPQLSGFTFTLTSPSGTTFTDTTGETGVLTFNGQLAPGTYTVREQVPSGWTVTTLNPLTVNAEAGKVTIVKFGNRRVVTVVETPTPTAAPTPAPTPTPTPTKRPEIAPSPPPPPPPSMTPPPTQSPWPALGTVTVTRTESCGSGCWRVDWTSPNTFDGFVLYGLQGWPRSNRVDASVTGSDSYTATMINLEAGRVYEFQAFAYPRNGSTPHRSAVMTFTAR